ncbi:ankyrin repeat-containing domain protein [Chytridium lagenaria]|nr:ankyrin repeat-containing domain protein [Chytridium lagenaria]
MKNQGLFCLPSAVLRHILILTNDFQLAIKLESVILGLPMLAECADYTHTFDRCTEADFPASMFLTRPFTPWNMYWGPPSFLGMITYGPLCKMSLSVVCWLHRFRSTDGLWSRDHLFYAINHDASPRFIRMLFQLKHHIHITEEVMEKAVEHTSRETIKFLLDMQPGSWTISATHKAAFFGRLDVIQLIHERGMAAFDARIMDVAAENGHIEVVKYLHEHRQEGCTTSAMDGAAEKGHLDTVKYLHENRNEGCTTLAMDRAAANGHFEIVKEGCTTYAMDYAAGDGHFEIVEFLHKNRSEGCTTIAINSASRTSLKVVQFLFESRDEGCTPAAFFAALSNLEVLKYLCENHQEKFPIAVMNEAFTHASREGYLASVEYLHSLGIISRENPGPLDEAAVAGHLNVVQFLHANQYFCFNPSAGTDSHKSFLGCRIF